MSHWRRCRLTCLPLAASVVFANGERAIGGVGLVALAQGIGVTAALAWLTAGHNPLPKR